MAIVYLISIKTLKEIYNVDENLDDKYIKLNIQKGQRFIINGILGDDKYNEILTQAGSSTLTTQNKYLIDEFISPILAFYVLSETVYTTAYKFKNLSITENYPNSDRFDELVKISKKYLRDSEQYQQLLKEYICENQVITTNEGKNNTIKTGIYLGNENRRKKNIHNSQYVDPDVGNNCFGCE